MCILLIITLSVRPRDADGKQSSGYLQILRAIRTIFQHQQVSPSQLIVHLSISSSIGYVLMNLDSGNDWTLRMRARKTTKQFIKHIKKQLMRLYRSIVNLVFFADLRLYNFKCSPP